MIFPLSVRFVIEFFGKGEERRKEHFSLFLLLLPGEGRRSRINLSAAALFFPLSKDANAPNRVMCGRADFSSSSFFPRKEGGIASPCRSKAKIPRRKGNRTPCTRQTCLFRSEEEERANLHFPKPDGRQLISLKKREEISTPPLSPWQKE